MSYPMSSIDPYGLLGATVHSTREQVKQAYYALSLIAHPDKGGSAADMIVVHNAYKYVMGQISEVNRTVTVDDLEARFASFCMDQLNEPPTFTEISVDMRQFHDAFDTLPHGSTEGHALCASMAAGYESSMESSEYRGNLGDVYERMTYLPLDVRRARVRHAEQTREERERTHGKSECVPFETQITSYVEPETSTTDTALYFSEMDHKDGLEDYGTACPFNMTDYRVAFSTNHEVLPEVSDWMLTRTFDDLVNQQETIPT